MRRPVYFDVGKSETWRPRCRLELVDLIFGWILFAAGVLSVLLHQMTTTGRVIFTFLCDEISEAVTRLDFFV